jgi:hypothetical protein
MAFKRLPRDGTEIPENVREGINAQLHELPAFREYIHDLIGVPLYFPRTKMVMVPNRLTSGGGADCLVIIGNATYRRGGYNLYVSRWELQRAERLRLTVTASRDLAASGAEMRAVMGGQRILVEVEPVVHVPRETPMPSQPLDPAGLFNTLPGPARLDRLSADAAGEPFAKTCTFIWASHGAEHQGDGFRDHHCENREPGHHNQAGELAVHVCPPPCGAEYDPDNPPKVPGFDPPGKHGTTSAVEAPRD